MPIRKAIPPVFLVLSLSLIYLATMAPGLTWANDGADGGDLITAVATGGVPHPTGYPTYLLMASLFQHLPFGTLAYRTNLFSAFWAILAALLVYATVTYQANLSGHKNAFAGLIAGLMFGLSPLVWSQAVITEVYTLHAFFMALMLFLIVRVSIQNRHLLLDGAKGLAMGLAAGNQITSLFLIPPVVFSSVRKSAKNLDWGAMGRIFVGLGAGLLVYMALPLRAFNNAIINWGNPVSLKGFWWLVTGELYQRRLIIIPVSGILQRLQDLATILFHQFELPAIYLALIGLVYYFKPTNLYIITIWNTVIFLAFALLYHTGDSYLYLIPVVLSISVWIGLGYSGITNQSMHYRFGLKQVVAVLICIFLSMLTVIRWQDVDASQDARAEQFGERIMESAPQNAILLAEDDRSIFALWYFHFALKQRPDIMVLASDLLHFAWYDDTLRATYPETRWPEGLFWQQTIAAANPERPECTVHFSEREIFECSSR